MLLGNLGPWCVQWEATLPELLCVLALVVKLAAFGLLTVLLPLSTIKKNRWLKGATPELLGLGCSEQPALRMGGPDKHPQQGQGHTCSFGGWLLP